MPPEMVALVPRVTVLVSVAVRVEPPALVTVWLNVVALVKVSVDLSYESENVELPASVVVAVSVAVPDEESTPVSYRLSKLFPPVTTPPDPSVVVAVWVSVEVSVLVSDPVPVRVSVEVSDSVAVRLLREDDSVVISVVVAVDESFTVDVSVPMSHAVWRSVPPDSTPPAPQVSLLDSVPVSSVRPRLGERGRIARGRGREVSERDPGQARGCGHGGRGRVGPR